MKIRLLIITTAMLVSCGHAFAADLRVMTFNIRYINPNDGDNAWQLRRDLLFRTIEKLDPDLLGMQEVTPLQTQETIARLKDYEFLGKPRNDGKFFGERAPVLFKRDRFKPIRSGTFWLSETSDIAGSKGWDADLPRVCSWVELRDKQSNDRPIYFFNTHSDHKGVKAREESAKLMRKMIDDIAGSNPTIVTGDFNSHQDSSPFKTLVRDRFAEAFAQTHPHPTTQDFTTHPFNGKNTGGGVRIDWILHSPEFSTKDAAINRSNDNGRYPSDHFPVQALLEWREK